MSHVWIKIARLVTRKEYASAAKITLNLKLTLIHANVLKISAIFRILPKTVFHAQNIVKSALTEFHVINVRLELSLARASAYLVLFLEITS